MKQTVEEAARTHWSESTIIIACILKDKINKMCTLKKWRID